MVIAVVVLTVSKHLYIDDTYNLCIALPTAATHPILITTDVQSCECSVRATQERWQQRTITTLMKCAVTETKVTAEQNAYCYENSVIVVPTVEIQSE